MKHVSINTKAETNKRLDWISSKIQFSVRVGEDESSDSQRRVKSCFMLESKLQRPSVRRMKCKWFLSWHPHTYPSCFHTLFMTLPHDICLSEWVSCECVFKIWQSDEEEKFILISIGSLLWLVNNVLGYLVYLENIDCCCLNKSVKSLEILRKHAVSWSLLPVSTMDRDKLI